MAVRGATDPKLGKRARAVRGGRGQVALALGLDQGWRRHWPPASRCCSCPAASSSTLRSGWPWACRRGRTPRLAGRAANTGLHVDDGLMTQGQAAAARFAAILATIAAVLGVAFATLRVLRVGRAFAALGRAMPELELATRARLARLLADEPELVAQLARAAGREQAVLPAVREAVKEFASDSFRLRQAVQAIADGYKGPARLAWMHGLNPDALAAVRRATPAELEEIAELMRGARNRADAEEILRQLVIQGPQGRAQGRRGVRGRRGRRRASSAAASRSSPRSARAAFPTGFRRLEAFKRFGQTVRDALRRYGVDVGEVRVHGSARAQPRARRHRRGRAWPTRRSSTPWPGSSSKPRTSAGNTKLAKTIAKEAAAREDSLRPLRRRAGREAGFEFGQRRAGRGRGQARPGITDQARKRVRHWALHPRPLSNPTGSSISPATASSRPEEAAARRRTASAATTPATGSCGSRSCATAASAWCATSTASGPIEQLLAAHRADYGAQPVRGALSHRPAPAVEAAGAGLDRSRADGSLGEYADMALDDEGEILAEDRFTPDGKRFAADGVRVRRRWRARADARARRRRQRALGVGVVTRAVRRPESNAGYGSGRAAVQARGDRGRGADAVALQPRQGLLSRDRLRQGPGDRVLHARRRRSCCRICAAAT